MSLLGRLRTGPRLFAAFLVVFLLSSVATVVGLVGLNRQHAAAVEADHLRVLVLEMDQSKHYTADFASWQDSYALDAYRYGPLKAIAPDDMNRQGLLGDIDAVRKTLATAHTDYMTLEERKDFDALKAEWESFIKLDDQLVAIYQSNTKDAGDRGTDWINTTQVNAYLELTKTSERMVSAVQERSQQVASDAAAAAATFRTATLVALVLALAAALLLARMVQLSVTRPLARCVEALRALGRKDLSAHLDVTSRGEMGDMAQALNEATVGVREAVTDMGGSVETLTAASAGLSQVAVRLAGSAEQVSRQAQGSAGAAQEVSLHVQSTASGADQMNASIREIAVNAQQAAQVAAPAVQTARSTSATVAKLGDSSAEIGNVLKVITSIAEQTNLLALNATIEATRAGEAGKGFAVVANEVKELAQETARATEDIAQRVEAIQADTGSATAAIATVSVSVSEIIDRINDYQSAIAAAVEEQTATTREMSRSVNEVAHGSSTMSASVQGLASAADAAQAEAASTQHASDELASLARQLRTLVGQFAV